MPDSFRAATSRSHTRIWFQLGMLRGRQPSLSCQAKADRRSAPREGGLSPSQIVPPHVRARLPEGVRRDSQGLTCAGRLVASTSGRVLKSEAPPKPV